MLWSHTLKEVPDVPTTILVFMMVSIFHIAISCVAITLNDPTIKVLIQSMINKAWPEEKELYWVHPRFWGGLRFALRYSFIVYFLFICSVSCAECYTCLWIVHSIFPSSIFSNIYLIQFDKKKYNSVIFC